MHFENLIYQSIKLRNILIEIVLHHVTKLMQSIPANMDTNHCLNDKKKEVILIEYLCIFYILFHLNVAPGGRSIIIGSVFIYPFRFSYDVLLWTSLSEITGYGYGV